MPRYSTRSLPPWPAPASWWLPATTTTCTWAPRALTCSRPPDQGLGTTPRHPMRFRDRPEIRVDSVRLIDTGSIDAEDASVYALEFGGNWKSLYLQGEHFWFDVDRAATSHAAGSGLRGLLPAGKLDTHRRTPPLQRGHGLVPESATPWCRSRAMADLGAWSWAARYSRMNLNFMEGIEGTAAAAGAVRGGDQDVIDARRQLVPESKRQGDAGLPDDRRGTLQSRRSRQHAALRPRAQHAADRRRRSGRISTCSRCERSSVSDQRLREVFLFGLRARRFLRRGILPAQNSQPPLKKPLSSPIYFGATRFQTYSMG